MSRSEIAVIGGGNGGQAMAGHLALMGHGVRLYSRSPDKRRRIEAQGGIRLTGVVEGFGVPQRVTNRLAQAVSGAGLVMVATTADAHASLARELAPLLEDGQVVVLNPGRTCGAVAFRQALHASGCRARVRIAEAQSLVYACRATTPGEVQIIGIKQHVPLAALPATETPSVLAALQSCYTCFEPADSVLVTSLENIGCIFHPAVVLLNAATIERSTPFLFYHDMTPRTAHLIEAVDAERLRLGEAYGVRLLSAGDWVAAAYEGIRGNSLCERMRNNPAYARILAPSTLDSRLLLEDIPTGLVPMTELARAAGVPTPLMESLIELSQTLLETDFRHTGRTLATLGLGGLTPEQIRFALQ